MYIVFREESVRNFNLINFVDINKCTERERDQASMMICDECGCKKYRQRLLI